MSFFAEETMHEGAAMRWLGVDWSRRLTTTKHRLKRAVQFYIAFNVILYVAAISPTLFRMNQSAAFPLPPALGGTVILGFAFLNTCLNFMFLLGAAIADIRIGDEPVCARCGYSLRVGFDTCPECGNPLDWNRETGCTIGRRWRPRARWVAAGVFATLTVVFGILFLIS